MPDTFFSLAEQERRDALGFAANTLARPPDILEKDVVVVWALETLYSSAHGNHLSFKGGTSLSKVYRLIDRFSEDIDLTYDIRHFLGEDFEVPESGLPSSKSQGRKWTDVVREKLPVWIDKELKPIFLEAAERDGLNLSLRQEANDRLYLDYSPLHTGQTDYVRPSVMLEFGARSTGEPTEVKDVDCDVAGILPQIAFPKTTVRAMQVGRTFWEKATAAHVYCVQQNLKGDRFSRHWHDLHYIGKSTYYDASVSDLELAGKVADHKAIFFAEKNKEGTAVDYRAAVEGQIALVPDGDALKALETDYKAMIDAGILSTAAPSFAEALSTCGEIQNRINGVIPTEKMGM